MVINNKLKYLGKIIEKGYLPIIANRGTFAFFDTGTIAACFHRVENNAEISLN
jgi:hypothetical protein